MTPDKIFKHLTTGNRLLNGQYYEYKLAKIRYDDDIIEYIRKDALLEWLKKEYETISWYYEKMKHVTRCIGDNSYSGKAEAYKKVIEKIESL